MIQIVDIGHLIDSIQAKYVRSRFGDNSPSHIPEGSDGKCC
jgi:hypothetical protein